MKNIRISIVVLSLFVGACSPLPKMVEEGDYDGVESAVSGGADLELLTQQNTTSLYQAVDSGQLEIVRLLVNGGADINAADLDDGWTPLIAAANKGYGRISDFLIRNKANLNAQNASGETALMHAVVKGHSGIVNQLIKAGADLEIRSNQGFTALQLALGPLGSESVAMPLIQGGADFKVKTIDGWNTLMLAARYGFERPVKALIAKGLPLNAANGDGWTPLMLTAAAGAGHAAIAKSLLSEKAHKNTKNADGDTALIVASRHGHYDIASLLVAKGADVNLANEDGDTPLIVASYYGRRNIIKLLMDNKAAVAKTNLQGKDAIKMAQDSQVADYIGRLSRDMWMVELKNNQKCKVKVSNWYYLGDQCANGLANGSGKAINPNSGEEFSGEFVAGQGTRGSLYENDQLVFEGGFNSNFQANGEGYCQYKGEPEKCEYYRGKRVDSLYKQRLQMLKQEELMAKQREEIDRLQREKDAALAKAQNSQGASGQQPVSEECMELGLALLACDQAPAGPFGAIRKGCKSLAESNYSCSIPLAELMELVK